MMLSIAAVMAGRVMAVGSTMPLPTVAATAVPPMAPSMLQTTAMMTARRGESTRRHHRGDDVRSVCPAVDELSRKHCRQGHDQSNRED